MRKSKDIFEVYNHKEELADKILHMTKDHRMCNMCHRPKGRINYFYLGEIGTNLNANYSSLCRACCMKLYNLYYERTKSKAASVWLLLAKMDIPFYYDLWQLAEVKIDEHIANKKGPAPSPFSVYLELFAKDETHSREGFYDSDTMIDVLYDERYKDFSEVERSRDFNLISQQGIWGKYVNANGRADIEAYDFLNKEYRQYTKDLGEINANLENRYRDLCRCELRLRRANESGDGQEISRAQDSLSKQLNLLKLNDFQSNNVSEEEKYVERMAWMIENVKPAECEDLNKYKDFSKITGVWEDLMRTVKNLVAGTREYPDIPKDAR